MQMDELGRGPAVPPSTQDLDAQDLGDWRARASRSAPPNRYALYATVVPPPRQRHVRAGAPAAPVDVPPLVARAGPAMVFLRPGPAPRGSRLDAVSAWVRGLATRLASAFTTHGWRT